MRHLLCPLLKPAIAYRTPPDKRLDCQPLPLLPYFFRLVEAVILGWVVI
ncbi:MAG: hypothetical protein F6K00_27345 [Leptolyngbya sp. SIOISBB]|nr:hypothetical protein [Leptolyngbya sp. SIOISBB]